MKIQFCGAAQEVTGSAHLITLDDGYKILLDCGLYQGGDDDMSQFNSEWLFDPSDINVLVLSHAHIDHCGRIPKLVKDGFRGNIYCTYATRDLSGILLMDSAQIQERDAEYINKVYKKKGQSNRKKKEPLYTLPDVTFAMQQFVSIGYERWFKIHDNVEVLFRDAGHILGSASVTLKIKEKGRQIMFGFTGDIGRPNRPILKDPIRMPRLDYVISESTYGDRVHLATPGEEEKFLKTLQHTCVDKRGKLIIPAFSVGRTQEVVYLMNKLYNEKKLPKIPVFVDSPLAVSATEIFLSHPECFDDELNNYMQKDDNPFGFKELQYIRKVEASKALNQINGPCIIISASGMANAGRIQHHLYNNIENPRNTVLMIGYCSPNTPGGQLRSGSPFLHLFGENLHVNAEVVTLDSFSAHGDKVEMLDFLSNQKESVEKLYLVHGTLDRQEKFKEFLHENSFKDILIPELEQSFIID